MKAKHARVRAKCKKARKLRGNRSDRRIPAPPPGTRTEAGPGTGTGTTGGTTTGTPGPATGTGGTTTSTPGPATGTGGTTTSTPGPGAGTGTTGGTSGAGTEAPGTATGAGTGAGTGATGGTTSAPADPGPRATAPILIPSGTVAIGVTASACSTPGTTACDIPEEEWTAPQGVYVTQTITEPKAVAEMIATVESLPLVSNTEDYECPVELTGEPRVELQFEEAPHEYAVVRATGSTDGCDFLYFRDGGKPQRAGRRGVGPVIALTEKLLGVKL